MACSDCRDALSAMIDGEAPPVGWDEARVASHLRRCEGCRTWQGAVQQHHRRLRMSVATPHGDLVDRVMASRPAAPRRSVRTGAAYALAAVGAAQIVLALPAVVLGDDLSRSASHATRELGIFGLALGLAMLWAARRPAQARALVPMMMALVGGILITAGLDVLRGDAALASEAVHLLDVAGLLLLHRVGRSSLPPAPHRDGGTYRRWRGRTRVALRPRPLSMVLTPRFAPSPEGQSSRAA